VRQLNSVADSKQYVEWFGAPADHAFVWTELVAFRRPRARPPLLWRPSVQASVDIRSRSQEVAAATCSNLDEFSSWLGAVSSELSVASTARVRRATRESLMVKELRRRIRCTLENEARNSLISDLRRAIVIEGSWRRPHEEARSSGNGAKKLKEAKDCGPPCYYY